MSSNALEATKDLNSPPSRSCAVTLGSDFDVSAGLGDTPALRLHVGTGGHVVARLMGDAADAWRTYKNVPSGGSLTGRFVAIRSTSNGTTAADIVALTY
jgi:hypothetical protein